jgi:DNA ligase (NAD+)
MKNTIAELAAKVTKARESYYNDTPIMSDAEFDALYDELKKLDPNNTAIISIGAPIKGKTEWKKAKHEIPMGSLDKVQTTDELSLWAMSKAKGKELFVTEKLDGISIELIYHNGHLDSAITRGDGVIGEEITYNVKKMQGVKSYLQGFSGSLRGEIIMHRSVHKGHFAKNANPRNAASGISKRFDSKGAEFLQILYYYCFTDWDFDREQDQFEYISNHLELPVPNWKVFKSVNEVNAFWQDYQDNVRQTLDYDIDGLVVRIDDLKAQQALGDHDMRPKGAIAFKFKHDSAVTTITDILNQVGNSGRITPVAVFTKVNLAGADITNATLHNYTNVRDRGVDIGAKVLISRRNDVIPFVESVIVPTGTYTPPTNCPACNSTLEFDGEYLRCLNTDSCPAQVIGRIKNWISTLNILEWGEALIERLCSSGKVKSIPDLYRLTSADLQSIERMGEKSSTKCLELLHASKELPLEQFLGGLSIPTIGTTMIKIIMVAGFDSLDKIRSMTRDQIENVHGMGSVKATNLFNGLRRNELLINDLLSLGIKPKEKIVGSLSGKSFCITGSTKNKRAVLEQMIVDNGGDVKGSVKGLNFLIIADPNSTSSKAVTARKNGTQCISEENFLDMIAG